ncbi:MAG: pyridoxal phosphate-dependent decarboxylase family protein, partial [Rubrobacter sp.]
MASPGREVGDRVRADSGVPGASLAGRSLEPNEDETGYEGEIRHLERAMRPLEPDAEERARLRDEVAAYADEFLEGLDHRPSFVVPDDDDGTHLDSPISEKPMDSAAVLKALERGVNRTGANVGSAGYLAYIPGSNLYASALADYLAAVTNRYAGLYFASPGAVRMERSLLRWMADFLGYPAGSAGDLTSGGSIANLVGIVTARDAHGLKARDFHKTVVYLGEQRHHAVDKALRIAGLEECVKRIIPLDERYRMRPDALERTIQEDARAGLSPWLITATAGTTDTGAVDPLSDVADVAQSHRLWLHVDGAYGSAFALTEQGR